MKKYKTIYSVLDKDDNLPIYFKTKRLYSTKHGAIEYMKWLNRYKNDKGYHVVYTHIDWKPLEV